MMKAYEGFNPFMPTAGVGIQLFYPKKCREDMFQSFYAHSGRWNLILSTQKVKRNLVSILLCPQRALEWA